MELTDKQIGLISHSLGVNYYNAQVSKNPKHKVLPKEFYRNYFNYGELGADIIALEEMGLIKYWDKFNNKYFSVTDKGIDLFKDVFKEGVTDKYVPLKKSMARYEAFLHADYGCTFHEYLGIRKPIKQRKDGLLRLVSTKYDDLFGEWKPTLKEAKISYKAGLKARI